MKSPLLFIIFNRPDTTKKVFDIIKDIKPERLFISADGPRKNNQKDIINCITARKIIEKIDWKCEVKTLFREENLGCKKAVSSGINWFFEHVEEGIILEDDCLPNQSFFYFCEELLNKYRNDKRIMHISGSNLQFGEKFGDGDYYFSYCPHVWGWATWKRAWDIYDVDMKDLDNSIKTNRTFILFKNKKLSSYWNSLFKHIRDKNIDTWDVQWNYSILKNKGLSITPNINLIENIGFGTEATHTTEANSKLKQKTGKLSEIKHPSHISPDLIADYKIYKKVYFRTIFDRIKTKIISFMKK